jgi:hypothetical protein
MELDKDQKSVSIGRQDFNLRIQSFRLKIESGNGGSPETWKSGALA